MKAMKKKSNRIIGRLSVPALCAAGLLLLPGSCAPEPLPIAWDYEVAEQLGEQAEGTTPVLLTFDVPGIDAEPATRSRFSEGTCSGYVLYVYQEGVLVQTLPFAGDSPTVQVSLKAGLKHTLALTRNIWRVDTGTGAFVPAEAPSLASGLPSWVYRVDGADAGSGHRFPTYAETVAKGIPAAGSAELTVADNPTLDPSVNRVNVTLRPLFAKISLKIDQSAIEGSTDKGYLTGSSVYVRGVNAAVAPFGSGSRATSSTLLAESDYDNPLDESAGAYTFFAPENMQGTDGSVADAGRKVPSLKGGLATYLEYNATVNSGNGISGNVVYKFCLGANATTDFNVERGKKYDVTLSFRVNSLLGDGPEWKVDASSVTDSRRFVLSKDATGAGASRFAETTVPAEMQVVVVRPSRSNALYPMVDVGGTVSALPAVTEAQATVSAHGVAVPDLATSRAVFVKEELDDLKDTYGVGASYDAATGRMTFAVSDASKFNAHIGQERIISAYIAPGYTRRMFKVRLKGNISLGVNDDLPLDKGFYIGMVRTIHLYQVSGTSTKGTFTTADGSTSGLSLSSDVNLTAGTYNAIKGTPGTVRDLAETQYLFAMARNASDSDKTTTLRVTFEDSYNNDPFEFDTRVLRPRLRIAPGVTAKTYGLPVDGTVRELGYGWYTEDDRRIYPYHSDPALELDCNFYKKIMWWFRSEGDLDGTSTFPKWRGDRIGARNLDGVLAAGQFLVEEPDYSDGVPPAIIIEVWPPSDAGKTIRYMDDGSVAEGWLRPGNRLLAFIGSFMGDASVSAMAHGTALGSRTVVPAWGPLRDGTNRLTYTFTASAPVMGSGNFSNINDSDWFDAARVSYDPASGEADCQTLTSTCTTFQKNGNSNFGWHFKDGFGSQEMVGSSLKHSYLTIGESQVTWTYSPLRRDRNTGKVLKEGGKYDAILDTAPIGEIAVNCSLTNRYSGESYGGEIRDGVRYLFSKLFTISYAVHLAQCVFYPSTPYVREARIAVGNRMMLEYELLRNAHPDAGFPASETGSGSSTLDILDNEFGIKGIIRGKGSTVEDFSVTSGSMYPSYPLSIPVWGTPDGVPGYDVSLQGDWWTVEAINKARQQYTPYPHVYGVSMTRDGGNTYKQVFEKRSNDLTAATRYHLSISSGPAGNTGNPTPLTGYGRY